MSKFPFLAKFATGPIALSAEAEMVYDTETETIKMNTKDNSSIIWATRTIITKADKDVTSDESSDR